jgi:hypothetical protein
MNAATKRLRFAPHPLKPRVVSELENFFESSEADFGLSSNFGPQMNRALSGGGSAGGVNRIDERMASRLRLKFEQDARGEFVDSTIAIQRAVRSALMALSPMDLEVLVRRHKHFRWPPEGVRAYSVVVGVVFLTDEALRRYAAAEAGDWPASRGKCPSTLESFILQAAQAYDATVIDALIEEAEEMVFAAHGAYAALRAPPRGDRGCGAFRRREPRRPPRKVSVVSRHWPKASGF